VPFSDGVFIRGGSGAALRSCRRLRVDAISPSVAFGGVCRKRRAILDDYAE
jgi:hypothetical protein